MLVCLATREVGVMANVAEKKKKKPSMLKWRN